MPGPTNLPPTLTPAPHDPDQGSQHPPPNPQRHGAFRLVMRPSHREPPSLYVQVHSERVACDPPPWVPRSGRCNGSLQCFRLAWPV